MSDAQDKTLVLVCRTLSNAARRRPLRAVVCLYRTSEPGGQESFSYHIRGPLSDAESGFPPCLVSRAGVGDGGQRRPSSVPRCQLSTSLDQCSVPFGAEHNRLASRCLWVASWPLGTLGTLGGRQTLRLGLHQYHRVRGSRVLPERMGNWLFGGCYNGRCVCTPNTNTALPRWSFRETLETLTLASLVRLKRKGGGARSVAQASLPFRCPQVIRKQWRHEFPDPAWAAWDACQALPLWTNGDATNSGDQGSLHIAQGWSR